MRGDTLEIFPANYGDTAVRVEFFGDEIDRITEVDVLTGEIKCELEHFAVFPASHYVVSPERMKAATEAIEKEMEEQVLYFKENDKLLEAQRIHGIRHPFPDLLWRPALVFQPKGQLMPHHVCHQLIIRILLHESYFKCTLFRIKLLHWFIFIIYRTFSLSVRSKL